MTLAESADRVIAELKELAELTSTPEGAQRVAWGPIWRQSRDWFEAKVKDMGLTMERDSAGNAWVTLPGKTEEVVIIGGHLDSVPNGGWLDGVLGTLSALEGLRRAQAAGDPDTGETYYRHWLAALERLCAEKGLALSDEVAARADEWRDAYLATPHGEAVSLDRD